MKIASKKSVLSGDILIPASKSHTIRAIAIAAMAKGSSMLINALHSEDTFSCIQGVKALGAKVTHEKELVIEGINASFARSVKKIDVGNSGTTLRILTALAALHNNPVIFDGDSSIRKRPMFPLISALENLGATIQSHEGKCPLTVKGPIRGGQTSVDGISSQFLTALLIACPLAENDTEITVENLHEKPYVEITLDWLRSQDIRFENNDLNWFKIYGKQSYKTFKRQIPADFSSATFALCAAAVTGSEILIKGLDFNDHQGDKEIFSHLEKMGASVRHKEKGVLVNCKKLKGMDIDMNNTPDALPALAVVGCFAEGTTRLLNVEQARLKECDRISAMNKELGKMGAKITELRDGLVIKQSKLKGTELHGYDDHRVVMALAIAGLGAKGETIIDTAESVKITYPSFVEDFTKMGAKIKTM